MSKRFGRSKRRAQREQIAMLREAQAMNTELIQLQRRTIDRQDSVLRRTSSVLGAWSAAAEAQTIRVANGDTLRLPKATSRMASSFSDPSQFPTYEVVDMLLARVRVDDHADCLHARVRLASGEMAYAISRKALDTIPKQFLVEEVATIVSKALVDYLRPVGGARHE